MTFQIDKAFTNQELRIPIETFGSQRIVCRAFNPKKPRTVYFDTAPIINGKDIFVVKIPKIPEVVYLEIYNEKNGNNLRHDPTFKVGTIQIAPIKGSFGITGMDAKLKSFADFSDFFAENAAILSSQNSIYRSDDGKFRIDYKDVIRDENGRELRTPARVNSKTKIIEIAKKYYLNYTVPARKALNWHEYAHVHINSNPEDEIEADKHAITIYLGTGNPIIEAYNVFLKVFHNTPSDLNKRRYIELNNFIKNFYKNISKPNLS